MQDFVLSHEHVTLQQLDLSSLRAATVWPSSEENERHALGKLKAYQVEIKKVEDWKGPAWAFVFIFHDLMERLGRIPTWPDVLTFLRGTARERLLDRFVVDFNLGAMDEVESQRYCAALRWRVGKAYYSFLREVDLFVRLRHQHGLPVRYNLLADAQFKIDFWCGEVLVALLIRNKEFRDQQAGRKRRVEDMMDASGFRRLELELLAPQTWGKPTLCPPAEVAVLVDALRDAIARGMPGKA